MPPRKKGDPVGGKPRTGKHGVHSNWVRTGGFIGDDAMAMGNKFNEEGAGVDESVITPIDNDPNAEFTEQERRSEGSEFGP